jgi:hypothetical protein
LRAKRRRRVESAVVGQRDLLVYLSLSATSLVVAEGSLISTVVAGERRTPDRTPARR